MRLLLRCLLVLLFVVPAAAQWPDDPALAPQLSNGLNSEIAPEVVTGSDEFLYVAWLQDMAPVGANVNFGIFLQRLDPQGRPQWAAGGIMIDAGIGTRN